MDLILRCRACANMISASVLSLSFDIISQYQPTLLSARCTCHAGACPVMMVPLACLGLLKTCLLSAVCK